MEISRKPSRRKFIRLAGNLDPGQYPHNLQFYAMPPNENISLAEFEDFAVERLKVLKIVETVGLRGMKGSKEYKEAMNKELNTLKNAGIMKGMVARFPSNQEGLTPEQFSERRKDHISHFILRLAYCRSEELRRWFLTQEVDLFRYRFSQETDKSIQVFLKENNLNYAPISEEEKQEIINELSAAMPIGGAPADITNFYKVPFTEALDLVRGRRVFLQGGYAYVPHQELVVIILSVFRARLSQALTLTCRALPTLEEDARLLPMLSSLSKRYLGQDYANKKPAAGNITAEQVDQMSQESFPLCMTSLNHAFRQNHHLRHWGRMQYGLFLKAIGLSLDEAMRFWRAEFTKAMDGDKFEKQYAYGIRHNYGKEGKRADYTPYSCVKIITSNTPGPGDSHGCPFKHSDADTLRLRLQGMGMGKDLLDEIKEDVKGGHYGLACGKYFNFKHNSSIDFSPSHPNEYFDTSRGLKEGKISAEGLPASNAATNTKSTKYYGAVSSQKSSSSSQGKKTEEFDDDLTMDDISMIEGGN